MANPCNFKPIRNLSVPILNLHLETLYKSVCYLSASQLPELQSDLGTPVVEDPVTGQLFRSNRTVTTAMAQDYVEMWNAVPTPLDRIWTNLTWSPELNLIVVTSHSTATDNIMTSPDGINWTVRTVPNTNNIRGVAWSPKLNLFATVASTGTGNRVNTSPDGITWTARSSPADYFFRDMVWVDELELFVAVANTLGVTDKVMTSPDGINWTLRNCPDRAWSDIVWAPELHLLCVSATTGAGGDKIMTSPDGINWTLQVTPFGSGVGNTASWEGLTWSGDLRLFVAVAFNGTAVNGTRVMTSPDGVNWTLRNTPADQSWLSVAWSPQLGMFAAVSAKVPSGLNVMTSPNGIDWTLQTVSDGINRDWRRIMWIKELGRFIAVAFFDGFGPPGNLIMMNRPIDNYQQYLSLYSRGSQQDIRGKIEITDTTTTDPAVLELTSTTRGLLLPRMTTTQRNAIASPVAGLVIYNTTTNKLNVYTTAWEQVTSA